MFFPLQQEADQIHLFPGGAVRPALHPLCLPPRRSEQLRFQDMDVCRAGAVVDAGTKKGANCVRGTRANWSTEVGSNKAQSLSVSFFMTTFHKLYLYIGEYLFLLIALEKHACYFSV